MSFPSSPDNGDVATVNGVIYIYNAAIDAWDRTSSGATLPANISNGNSSVNIAANANVTITSRSNAILVVTGTGANIAGTANITGNANVGNLGTATAIITTANITTINNGLHQNGNSNIAITANSNITMTAKSNATVVVSDTGANIAGTANISGNANVGNLGTGGLIIATGNVTGGNLVATSNIQINGNKIRSSTGNAAITLNDIDVTVEGNLIVQGATTTLNTATLDIEDLNITLAKGSGSAAAANGAGITIDGASATLLYINSSNTWTFDRGLTVNGIANITGNANTGNLGTATIIATTANLTTINSGLLQNSTSNITVTSAGNISTFIGGNATAQLVVTPTGANIVGNANVGNIGTGTVIATVANLSTINGGLLQNGTSNVTVNSSGNVNISVGGNVLTVTASGANITGTLNSGDATVSNLTAANTTVGNLTTAGNISAGNISVTANLSIANLNTTNIVATTANLTTINSGKMQNGNSNVVIAPNGNVTLTSTSNATMIVTGTGVNIAGTANITSTLTTVGDIVVSSGNAATSITTGALRVTGGIGTQGNLFVGGNLTTSNAVSVTYTPASATGVAITTTGKDTVGGTGYFDFLKATNTTSGVTNGAKTLRLNNVGTLEVLNSAYNATVLSVTDAGFIAINQSSGATDGVPVNNGIAMGNNSYIFDDGNYHITAKTGVIWLNSNNGSPVNVNLQMPSGVTGGGMQVAGAVKSNAAGAAATAFISGAGAISGVALQMDSGTAGTAASMAIRDTSTVASTMYFDVSTGGSANGTFRWRSSNSFTEFMSVNSTQLQINEPVTMGGSTVTAYLSVIGSKSYAISAYGYLGTGGAGTVSGSSGTVAYGIYCANRIQSGEVDVTSDERAKDIQGTIPLDKALQFVRGVDGILYTWKPGFGDDGVKSGFSAQGVHKAGFDHMIGHIPNENLSGDADDDGWTHPDKMQLTMGYNQAIPYHHEVIKNLLERIEKLEAKIAELSDGK